ncbi:MAG TPA: hypothetical protein VF469_19305 [Kofleriaceae bacterium]
MAETHDPSSPEMRAGSSDIPLHNDTIAAREKRALRPSEVPLTCLTEGTEDIAVRDRELRVFCRRLLGSSEARSFQVDDAVDGMLTAVARGMPIALRGASDLVPVAYALHRRILGADRPFVVCDPRRREGEGSVRAPPSRWTVALAVEAAMDGSICLRSRRLPADFDRLRESVREAAPFPAVFVCLHGDDRVRDLFCRPLEIPPLTARASESHRLFQEALDEAAAALGTARLRIPQQARQGVLERVASFAELEKTALRIVALASARNPSQAAVRLQMAPVSLKRWLHRRPWLMAVLRELKAYRFHADD